MQEVINGIIEAILLLDNIINAWIVEIRHPLLTKIMASVTGLGSATACFAFLGVFYLAGWTEEWRAAGTGLLLTGITVASLMMAVQRSFPRSPVCLVKGNEMVAHSFPSGHAAAVTVFALTTTQSERLPFLPVVALAALICISRFYLGTHYFSDTISGILIGICCGMAGRWISRHTSVAAHLRRLDPADN
jgi:undecaprenyl-diphosphatase